MSTILIADDEKLFGEALSIALATQEIEVVLATDGVTAFEKLQALKPDLAILDINMPKMNGLEVLKKIRLHQELKNLYVIMLTAQNSETDIINGLESGADDFVGKPFSLPQLISRIKAGLRRSLQTADTISASADTEIPTTGLAWIQNANDIYLDGRLLKLTHIEYKLLTLFLANLNTVFAKKDLLTDVLGYNKEAQTRTIDTHIKNLRAKLADNEILKDAIISLYSQGFKFVVPQNFPIVIFKSKAYL